MPRYADVEHSREARGSSRRERERDPRDRVETRERRTIEDRMDIRDTRMEDPMDIRMDHRMDTRIDPRMDSRLDPRMDSRIDPRANAAARLESRPDRGTDRSRETEYRDARTGELLYRDPPSSRSPFTRDDRDDLVPSSRSRTIVDTGISRDRVDDTTRPEYNEYFLPGDGIDREVIQHEICRYLGQDATCRPYRHQDGRTGYLVRAYRTFTTAMINSLKEDTIRWRLEREKRVRQGRSQGSYADMRDRQERRYDERMEVDDYDPPAARHRDPDPRTSASSRHAIPVSTGYPPEPGYTTQYSLSSNQPGIYGPDSQPRTYAGNTTPPSMARGSQSAYGQPGYPARTSASVAPIPITTYTDPRTGETIRTYPAGYQPEPRRHGR